MTQMVKKWGKTDDELKQWCFFRICCRINIRYTHRYRYFYKTSMGILNKNTPKKQDTYRKSKRYLMSKEPRSCLLSIDIIQYNPKHFNHCIFFYQRIKILHQAGVWVGSCNIQAGVWVRSCNIQVRSMLIICLLYHHNSRFAMRTKGMQITKGYQKLITQARLGIMLSIMLNLSVNPGLICFEAFC